MSTEFDPYYQWLGIPADEQPPNHYRLLGIREQEPDRGVIANAADRQMLHLRSFQSSHHSALCQKLLNEVSAAKMCLLASDRKAAYDAELMAANAAATPPTPPPPPEAPPLPGEIAGSIAAPTSPSTTMPPLPTSHANAVPDGESQTAAGKRKRIWVAMGGLAVVVIALVVAAMTGTFSKDQVPPVVRAPVNAEPAKPPTSAKISDQSVSPGDTTAKEPSGMTDASDNHSPVLDAVGSQTVSPGSLLWVRLSAHDADVPQQTLTYELVSGPPGARVDPVRGDFLWRPDIDDVHLEFRTTVAVKDGAGGRDVQTFLIDTEREAEFEPLLKYLAAQTHGISGQWATSDDGLTCGGGGAKLRLPVELQGDYDLRVEFTCQEDNGAAFLLPVGGKLAEMFLGDGELQLDIRSRLRTDLTGSPRAIPIRDGERNTLEFFVRVAPDTACIVASVNGKVCESWIGPIAKLQNEVKMPSANEIGLFANMPITYHAIGLRTADDEFRLADDAVKPGATDLPLTAPEPVVSQPPPPKPDLRIVAHDVVARLAAADTESTLHTLLYDALQLIDDTCRESRYDLAEQTARALHEAVKRVGVDTWNQPFLLLVGQFKAEQSGWKTVQEALQQLETEPEDEAANAVAGSWHGLHQGDWDRAVRYLAKGDDPQLAALSAADLAADSSRPAVCAARGDAWWIAALTAGAAERDMLMRRAGQWYRKIPNSAPSDLLSPERRRRLQDVARAEQRCMHSFVELCSRFPKNEAASLQAAADVAGGAGLDTRHSQLAFAARLLQLASRAAGKDKQRAILLDAEAAAANQGDPLLVLTAVDRLETVIGCSLFDKKCQALTQSIARTRFVSAAEAQAAINACLDLMPQVDDTSSFDALLVVFGGAQRLVRKFSDEEFNAWSDQQRRNVNTQYELFTKAEEAVAKLAGADDHLNPADTALAKLHVARFHGLCKRDWTAVLPLLAEGSSVPLSEAAQQIVDAPDDAVVKKDMADAWWDLSVAEVHNPHLKTLLRTAALHWYGEALPGAAGADYDEVQRRLSVGFGEEAEDQPITRLSVALGGVAGRTYMRSGNSTSLEIENGGVGMTRRGGLVFGSVPATSFVHEFEIGFLEENGSLRMSYGEGQGCRIQMDWSELERKVVCHLEQYADAESQWDGDHHFDAQRKIAMTLYVAADRQWLFQDSKKILEAGGPASDLRFSVFAEDNTKVSMPRCEFRPFNSTDAARLGVAMPADESRETVTSTQDAVIAVYARNLGLPDRPMLKRPDAFVVATTETPMVWIKPGTFTRKYSFEEATPTKVTMTKGFWIGRYEISRAEWSRVTEKPISLGDRSPLAPVRRIDWRDAMKFCSLLTQQEKKSRRVPEGYEYRLPTEAEWELACRAGETADWSVEPDRFWHSQTSGGRPHDVGQSEANAWGLFDMHGNVAEWCFDRYTSEPFSPPEALSDPVEVPASPNDSFVLRGGAWTMQPDECSSRSRSQSRSAGRPHVGFRIVLATIAPRPQPKPMTTPQKGPRRQGRDRDGG